MARIRSIKPDFFASEDVSVLPMRARLTWIGLWTHCDDHGRTKDNAKLIKAAVWPLDNVNLREIEEDLAVLADHGRIVRYQVDGKPYLAVVNWHAHQAINRPSKAKHPAPPAPLGSADTEDPNHCAVCAQPGTGGTVPANPGTIAEPSTDPHATLTEDSVSPHPALTPGREGKGGEGKGRDVRAGARETAPAPSAVAFVPPQDPENRATPPPDRCPKHLGHPDPPPCGPCADARRAATRWQQHQAATAAAAQQAAAHQRAAAVRAAIDACHLCDHTGYRDGHLCAHDPAAADRTRRGAAAARAALTRKDTHA